MKQRSPSQPMALFAVIVATLAAASTLGCADDPISPSVVTRLRILGLSPTPAEPSPGDQVTLDLLWTDPPTSCNAELPCPVGQSCQTGQCVRDDETVNVVWLVSRLAAWQSTDTTATDGGFAGILTSGIEIPGLGECSFDQESCSLSCGGIGDLSLWDLCTMACQGFEGSDISLCCGGAEAGQFNVTVPEDIVVPPPECGGETSIDTSQILQVQAQVCVGGRINLCDLDINSLSFGCEGEGAESVTALSRVHIAHDPAEANLAPVVEEPTWGRWQSTEVVPWNDETVIEVEGCLDSECATRILQPARRLLTILRRRSARATTSTSPREIVLAPPPISQGERRHVRRASAERSSRSRCRPRPRKRTSEPVTRRHRAKRQ